LTSAKRLSIGIGAGAGVDEGITVPYNFRNASRSAATPARICVPSFVVIVLMS